MKLVFNFTVELDVADLKDWISPDGVAATSVEEAAKFQQNYMINGDIDPVDIFSSADSFSCTVEGVE